MKTLPGPQDPEFIENLLKTGAVRVERIVSTGHVSPPGYWYDQEEDEWVLLLQGRARLEYEDGGGDALERGDWVFIPAHRRHRVAYTSETPFCLWLAIFVDSAAS